MSEYLFDMDTIPVGEKGIALKGLEAPVWTENKAQLIQRYLRYFVFITKHGTYLDGFAAPQSPEHADLSCAAKLVLASEPKWFRTFALFDRDKAGIAYLQSIATSEKTSKRSVEVFSGDSNVTLPTYLKLYPIPDKEATFCLLDQRTFECNWRTVEAIAGHKRGGNKIEIFYFLAQGWLDRSIAAIKDPDALLTPWWGNTGWKILAAKPCAERGNFLADRFKKELGYRHAHAYPIFERNGHNGVGKIMFWMIHASDHDEAPKLMVRAYNNVVAPLEPITQLEIELGLVEASPISAALS